jgi:hypothetical protein
MNSLGYLAAGKPQYESGRAAYMSLGREAPYRALLYTTASAHRGPALGPRPPDYRNRKTMISPGDNNYPYTCRH